MTKTISVKELRTKLPAIRRELKRGVSFEVIYRSKPLARLVPAVFPPTPKKALELFANPPKSLLFRNKKSAVQMIREERGNR